MLLVAMRRFELLDGGKSDRHREVVALCGHRRYDDPLACWHVYLVPVSLPPDCNILRAAEPAFGGLRVVRRG
jgi:hypothetical protein